MGWPLAGNSGNSSTITPGHKSELNPVEASEPGIRPLVHPRWWLRSLEVEHSSVLSRLKGIPRRLAGRAARRVRVSIDVGHSQDIEFAARNECGMIFMNGFDITRLGRCACANVQRL